MGYRASSGGGGCTAMRLLPTRFISWRERKRAAGSGGGGRTTHLYLNVYDLTPINKYLYWFGLGIFHSGIEGHGMEYGFGAHEYPSSGVFEVEPKSCPGFIFRRSLCVGTTDMSRMEFRIFMEHLAGKYHGDTYHLIFKNCNNFTNEVCQHLTGKPIPRWVNRVARLGSFCNCFIPHTIHGSTVKRIQDNSANDGDEELESCLSSVDGGSIEEGISRHLLTPCSDPGPSREAML